MFLISGFSLYRFMIIPSIHSYSSYRFSGIVFVVIVYIILVLFKKSTKIPVHINILYLLLILTQITSLLINKYPCNVFLLNFLSFTYLIIVIKYSTIKISKEVVINTILIFLSIVIFSELAVTKSQNLYQLLNKGSQGVFSPINNAYNGVYANSNPTSNLFLISIALSLTILYLKPKNILYKLISVIYFITFSFMGSLTLTSTFYLVYAILIFFFLIFYFKTFNKYKLRLYFLIPLIILSLTITFLFVNYLYTNNINEIADNLFSSRISIWSNYIQNFLNDKNIVLWGVGSGNSNHITTGIKVVNKVWKAPFVHNGYLEVLIDLGIIGTTILMSIYCNIFKDSRYKYIILIAISTYLCLFVYDIRNWSFVYFSLVFMTLITKFESEPINNETN